MWILNQVKGEGGAWQTGTDYTEADKDSAFIDSTASHKNAEEQGGFAKLVFLHFWLGKLRGLTSLTLKRICVKH